MILKKYLSTFYELLINALYNYWDAASVEAAKRRVQDNCVDSQGNPANFKVIIEPIALQKIADAYPE